MGKYVYGVYWYLTFVNLKGHCQGHSNFDDLYVIQDPS